MLSAKNNPIKITMSFVSFEQSRDLIQAAQDKSRAPGENFTYLNTMVDPADKEMVLALSRRHGVSQGFIMREIFSQWREYVLNNEDCE